MDFEALFKKLYHEKTNAPANFEKKVMLSLTKTRIKPKYQSLKLALGLVFLIGAGLIFLFTMISTNNHYVLKTITYQSEDAQEIFIMGDFNNWEKIKLNKTNSQWSVDIKIKPGIYNYLFIVDGQLMGDKSTPVTNKGYFGESNSVLVILK